MSRIQPSPCTIERMDDRALSFGASAAAYERYRPGYPMEVAERILDYAAGPLTTALEIGAGTGKATRLLAARGIDITATEPDPLMLDELRSRVPSATAVRATFEEVPLDRAYDLVFAAASLHWTQPDGRWDRVAALLRPGGTFASFGGPMRPADPALEAAVLAARNAVLPSDDVPGASLVAAGAPLQWPGTELAASPSFTAVEQHVIPRRVTVTSEDWIGHLSTISAYLVLPESDRAEAFRRTAAVLPPEVEAIADVVLHLATRV